MIRIKRIYDPPGEGDGFRVLVDRLWPRGVSKDEADIDLWVRDVAPSDGLRKWFSHDPGKWEEFRKRYRKELEASEEALRRIRALEREKGTVTLLYSAKDEEHNNAVALKDVLEG